MEAFLHDKGWCVWYPRKGNEKTYHVLWLMSSENVEDLKNLGIYINESFQARR